jgi:hypothetical protein
MRRFLIALGIAVGVMGSYFYMTPAEVASQIGYNSGTTVTGYTDGGVPAAGASGDIWQFDATLGIMDGSDTIGGLVIGITNADHTGSTNVLNAFEIEAITGDAQATETAIRLGDGYDIDIYFPATGEVDYTTQLNIGSDANNGIIVFQNQTTTTYQFRNIMTGSANIDGATFKPTITAMTGSNEIIVLDINVDNADHTGSANFLYGLNVDDITADAQATEIGLRISDGWDSQLILDATTPRMEFGDSLSSQFLISSPVAQGGGTVITIAGASAAVPAVKIQGYQWLSGNQESLQIVPAFHGAMNGSDRMTYIDIEAFTDADHTGTGNIKTGLNAGTITSPDTHTINTVISMDDGWDAFALLDVGDTAWAATDSVPAGSVALFVQEGVNASADCQLIARLANDTEIVVATLVSADVCP